MMEDWGNYEIDDINQNNLNEENKTGIYDEEGDK